MSREIPLFIARELIKQWRPVDLSLALQVYRGSALGEIPGDAEVISGQARLFLLAGCVSFAVGQNHSGLFMGAGYRFSDLFPYFDVQNEGKHWEVGAIFQETCSDLPAELSYDESVEMVYFQRWFKTESELAGYFAKYLLAPTVDFPSALQEAFARCFPAEEVCSNPWQAVAALSSLTHRFSIITGGPGTGKTTTIARLVTLLLQPKENNPLRMAMVAPTGKAADRLRESFDGNMRTLLAQDEKLFSSEIQDRLSKALLPAQTIHRLLVPQKNGGFFYHQKNRLDIDVLIVDEASMVNLQLFLSLFRALPDSCQVILLGDPNQLAAVETGNVLSDVIRVHRDRTDRNQRSAWFTQCFAEITQVELPRGGRDAENAKDYLTELEISYRFLQDSSVSYWAKFFLNHDRFPKKEEMREGVAAMKKGWISQVYDLFRPYKEALATDASPSELLAQMARFRVLCAVRQGEQGVEFVNQLLAEFVLREAYRARQPVHGLPFMITENSSSLGLWNGDMGVFCLNEKNILQAYFSPSEGAEVRVFSLYSLPAWELAFATTVHKAQGSEFEKVVFLLPEESSRLITWELIYTAITRAKTDIQVLLPTSYAGKPLARTVRHSGLRQRVEQLLDENLATAR